MSAFVVSPECMTRCVNAIMESVDEFAGISTKRYRECPPLAELDQAGTNIGAVLYRLNSNAVAQRYPGDDEMAAIPPWHWHYECPTTKQTETLEQLTVAFKALDCLSYQCSEGDIPGTALYAELDKVIGLVAGRLARRTPEYDRAPWD